MLTSQAAEYLGVHPTRVRQLAAAGEIRCQKLGRDWLFTRKALDEYRATLAERNAGKKGRPFKA